VVDFQVEELAEVGNQNFNIKKARNCGLFCHIV